MKKTHESKAQKKQARSLTRKELKQQIKEKKAVFFVYTTLRILVIGFLVFAILSGNFENAFICLLVLILYMVPFLLQRRLNIQLPSALEILLLIFIFAAEILGEIQSYFVHFRYWDLILHTTSGFVCAAFGFAMVDILNKNKKIKMQLSPLYLALAAFCFSMTIGVIWEFFEFGVDTLFHKDMQKDTVIHSFASVTLDETKNNIPIYVSDITDVTINGESLELGGYLDIGLYDTMEDLFVNFIGAVLFSVVGFFNAKSKGKSKIASAFIPTIREEDDSSGLEGAFDEDP